MVARPDDYWGETPCAFVTLKEGAGDCDEATIMEWCQGQMARFKVPKTVIFGAAAENVDWQDPEVRAA